MKTDTFNHYAVRIDRAIALLAQRLAAGEPPPTLDEMAAAAHFSPFHFHRIYRALTQETLAQTVARLRQDRAAVHGRGHTLDGDAAFRVSGKDRGGNGGWTAMSGEKRGMQVDRPAQEEGQELRSEDAAVGDHDEELGIEGTNAVPQRLVQALRL